VGRGAATRGQYWLVSTPIEESTLYGRGFSLPPSEHQRSWLLTELALMDSAVDVDLDAWRLSAVEHDLSVAKIIANRLDFALLLQSFRPWSAISCVHENINILMHEALVSA
jgi:hypothetical protein